MKDGKSVIDQEKCIKCGKCKDICPYDAICHKGLEHVRGHFGAELSRKGRSHLGNNLLSDHYEITSACMGCVAHPCQSVCPKGAISMKDGKSVIDQEKCIKARSATSRKTLLLFCLTGVSIPLMLLIYAAPPCDRHALSALGVGDSEKDSLWKNYHLWGNRKGDCGAERAAPNVRSGSGKCLFFNNISLTY